MSKNSKHYARGASASLNKTITDIEKFVDGNKLAPVGSGLRADLHKSIEKLARKWYRRGFKRGCIEMHKAGKLRPKGMDYDATRDFYSGEKSRVTVKWKAKKKKS